MAGEEEKDNRGKIAPALEKWGVTIEGSLWEEMQDVWGWAEMELCSA